MFLEKCYRYLHSLEMQFCLFHLGAKKIGTYQKDTLHRQICVFVSWLEETWKQSPLPFSCLCKSMETALGIRSGVRGHMKQGYFYLRGTRQGNRWSSRDLELCNVFTQ